jgi:phage tail-like protein
VSQDRRLYDWYRAVARGREDVRELTVVQLDCPSGTVVNIWRLEKATPVRWTGPSFDSLSDDFAVEELEIRYASIAWRSSLDVDGNKAGG